MTMPGFQSPNYTQAPNDWFDEYLPLQGYAEMKVTAVVLRNTLGFHKKRFELSLTAMARKTGLSETNVIVGAEAAEKRGLIQRVNKGSGRRRKTVWEAVIGTGTTSATEVVIGNATSATEVALPLLQRQTTSATEGRTKKPKETKKNNLTTSAALNTSAAEAAAAAVHGDWWSLPVLVSAGKLPKDHKAAMAEANPSPGAYVSKYLYAVAKRGFTKPPLWAARQVATNPGAWEGDPYESLAALGPAGVAKVLAWLRDDAAYPIDLNGATHLALLMRGDLKDKYKGEPERMCVAAGDALVDLGLARLVQPADTTEPEPAPAPVAAPADPWLAFLQTAMKNGQINNGGFDRLMRCRLQSHDGGAYVVSVPTKNELDFIKHRLAMFTSTVNVTFNLQEEN
jgi:hypothetical protein